jgi:hypothetical protein
LTTLVDFNHFGTTISTVELDNGSKSESYLSEAGKGKREATETKR